jgi:hypothetical protein
MDCAVELNTENAYVKSGRHRGWHGRCRSCSAKHRRAHRQAIEDDRRSHITRDACDICGARETLTRGGHVRRLNIDHDHQTGALRGVLCSRCNTALGMFGDDPAKLRAAAAYLENPPGVTLAD